MAQVAWGARFKINRDDKHIAERIRAFEVPGRRPAQPQIPGPEYRAVISGKAAAPPRYPTLAAPYFWSQRERETALPAPVVGYSGHRQGMRQVLSQSTFLPINKDAGLVRDPWASTASVSFTGHRDEIQRLARSRSAVVLERLSTVKHMRQSDGMET